MRLPFGLDLKSLVIGALFVWFILPMIMQFLGRARRATNES